MSKSNIAPGIHLFAQLAGLLLLLLGLNAAAQAVDRVVDFDIPSQPMSSALVQFGKQAAVQVLSSEGEVAGVAARPVKGRIGVREAIAKLIEGSGLVATFRGADTIVIKASDDRAKAKATSEVFRAESIMVTATKREERLEDVPISMAVVTRDDIDRRGIVHTGEYLRGIPGANQAQGAPNQTIVIRGIETSTTFQNFAGGETTGTYFGETPTVGIAGLAGSNIDIKLVDIDRVEVLRGPQGTAFGSASLGGTVRTIPTAPRLDRFEGKTAAGYSFTSGYGGSNYNVEAMLNVPLITNELALRAVAYSNKETGYYRSRSASNATFQALATRFGATAFAADFDQVGTYWVHGGRIAALFRPNGRLSFSASYLSQRDETDGYPLATSGSYEQTLFLVAPEHARRGQSAGVIDHKVDIANVVIQYELGWADFIATYSDIKGETVYGRPFTAIGFNWAASNDIQTPHRGRVGEIRVSTKLEGKWNFLAGLYAEHSDDTYAQDTIWFGDLSRSLFPTGGRDLQDYLDQRAMKQKAAFGEVSLEVLPRLTFTAGGRAFSYDRDASLTQGGFLGGGAATTTVRNTEESDSIFRANLSYKPGEDWLLYGGWSQGFRVGSPQAGLSAALCDLDGDGVIDGSDTTIESTRKVGSDTMDNYEVGSRFTTLNRRLSIDTAVFRMNWSGLRVARNFLNNPRIPNCVGSFSANVGTARSDGVEFQAVLRVTDALRISFGGSHINARVTGQGTPDLPAGKQLPGAPKDNVNLGVQYDFTLADYKAFVRSDATYVGSFYGDILNSPVTKAGNYTKLDASARITVNRLNVDLFVQNLTNDDSFIYRGPYNFATLGPYYGYQLRPRTFGVRVGYRF